MTVPHYINEHQSDIRAIKPGWYGVENNGKLSCGPYPNHGECLTGITQARGEMVTIDPLDLEAALERDAASPRPTNWASVPVAKDRVC
jgi:hypothetical protein